jgi:hypothetical protein
MGALVFVVVATVYLSCPVKGVSDLIWSIPTIFSILQEGDADLDEYEPTFDPIGAGVRAVLAAAATVLQRAQCLARPSVP